MNCPKCGFDMPVGMKYCGSCGTDISQLKTMDESKAAGQSRNCVKCGRSINWRANVCPYCGHDYRNGQYSAKNATVGGILTVLASIISIFFLAYFYLSTHQYYQYDYYYGYSYVSYDWMIYLFLASMSILGIIGGICALGKAFYSMAVAGAACSVIGPGFFFGIPGLITIVNSSKEFKHPVYHMPPQTPRM
jgi:hypothetical protein